jgi:hypothetical protein
MIFRPQDVGHAAQAYRSDAPPRRSGEPDRDGAIEALHPVVALVGLASFVRVAGAVVRHEVFGGEATLALMTLVAIAWAALATRRA